MNAREEIIERIGTRAVLYVRAKRLAYRVEDEEVIEGTLSAVLPRLEFDYHNGYGGQELEGTIWYSDDTWSERGEYDGSEWWEHRECPPLPTAESSPLPLNQS